MTKAEDEEKILLSSLGVTSANVEDVERKILSEAKEEDPNSKKQEKNESSKTQNKLLNKLHAINLEIEAVSSGLKKGKSVKSDNSDNEQKKEEKEKDEGKIKNSKNLQKALVIDRLKSLKRTKLQIEQQLNESGAGPSKRENIKPKELTIQNLVKENPKKGKGVLKNEVKKGKGVLKHVVKKSGTDAKKPMKIVSYQEDTEFDAILDAAASGFMETEREKLVRKGILTPFHSLKGFEKQVKPKPTKPDNPSSVRQNASINPIDPLEAESIARLNKSMAEIARSRPSTKLMDANQLPALDPPAVPFQRIRNPLKRPVSPGRKKERKSKRKRPLPDIKWRREKIIEGVSEEEKDKEEEEETSCTDSDAESEPDIILEGGLNIPSKIYNQLFDYQKIGVQWLWELHCQKAGGIIGDEMGLGKTIQVLSFLASLHHSDLYKPSIVICPVTLLRQWKREAEKWYPEFRVEILHDSANVGISRKVQESEESEIEDSDEDFESEKKKPRGFKRNPKKWDELIKRVLDSDSGLLITTYEQIRLLGEKLIDVNWGYAILDEGHRIRNPNAEITLICKQFRTMHRIIMTGAPIQNKLSELWSLFDFVFPGKLGVLPVFEAEFSVPITVGGYVNANPLQVSTAYRCAVVLRDLIMPYLLRRMKADVDAQLPKKTEHVLFCSLTPEQRSIYRSFLASSEVEQIFDGRRNSLSGIDVLKKICNHPDLLERETSERNPDYGNFERSGKMKVVEQVLRVWKEQGHRVLFFAQTQQMLDIMENFMNLKGYVYRRMDGYTPVKQRMALMDEFNNSNEVFVFILTTRVGGLGTNLTGANRVIIYDPDWNPSTDMQARERAWRIGQKKDVTVYRLITRGTIEEKIYQRQIYKHFLTNKVLKDPRQKRVFKARDMRDLFTLQDEVGTTETSNIFGQLSEDVNVGVENEKSGKNENENNKSSDKGKEKVKEEEEEREKGDGETNILKSLFDAHGIHSAMNHDAILNVNEDQKVRMEKEVAQVAQRATEALRQSRMDRAREDFAVPTWTGRAGAAGAPSSVRRRFGSTVNPVHRAARPPSPSLEPSRIAVGVNGSRRALSSSEVVRRINGTRASAVFDAMEADLAPARLASPEVSRSRVVMNALPAGGTVRVNNNRRGLSSSEVLSRISRTHASAVSDAMETDSVHARLASPEASRSRALTALPAGRDLSSDSSEGSRRRVRTALPVGNIENKRGANRGDVSSDSSGDSRSRVLTALPVHGTHASAVSDAMETDLVSARLASPDVSTSRVVSPLPVGARVANAVPDAI